MISTSDIRKQNILAVVRAFSRRERMTKNDVAVETGLTLMTVNTLVNGLMASGVIREDGCSESAGGRPASFYRLCTEGRFIAGIDIHLDGCAVQISNLCMQRVHFAELPMAKGTNSADTLHLVVTELRRALEELGAARSALLGIGVVLPAVVDSADGLHSLFLHSRMWEKFPAKQILAQEFGAKVMVEKDTYASVLRLKRQLGQELRNAISVIIKGGIGGGILMDGRIFRGENGAAGEFGHMCMEMGGLKCRCGSRGCLEMYASDIAVLGRAREMLQAGEESVLCSLANARALDVEMLAAGYNAGDPLCRRVLDDAVNYLCEGIANLAKMYDPSHILLESVWVKQAPAICERIGREVAQRCDFQGKAGVDIHFSADRDLHVNGAIDLVYENLLNSTEDNPFLLGMNG